ncbi:hypothetical protein GG851_26810 [Bordetella petrii]|nr:hypothetical protein [Bordetella petrii]
MVALFCDGFVATRCRAPYAASCWPGRCSIRELRLTQAEAVQCMGLTQPKVSALLRVQLGAIRPAPH